MQRPMITKEGIYTQGIYGFINMLTKIQDDYAPDYITVAGTGKRRPSGTKNTKSIRLDEKNAARIGHGDSSDEGYFDSYEH